MSFADKYNEIKQKSFDLVYYEAHPFIEKNWKKVKDWSKLGFDYYDFTKGITLKYGPKKDFPIKVIEDRMNKDRTGIKTLKIGFTDGMADSLTINGLKFNFLDEELVITLATYIEKRI